MKDSKEQISKLVSYWLRHKPDDAGLSLDEFGWADLDKLLQALEEKGHPFSMAELMSLNNSFDKVRWEITADKIRATHGHSVPVISDKAQLPPEVLYHGTSLKVLPKIMAEGLLPMNRQFVHLSDNPEDAAVVGKRHGKPFIIEIFTEDLVKAGWVFYQTSEKIWLTTAMPVEYLSFLPWHKEEDAGLGILEELKREVEDQPDHLVYPHLNDLVLIWRSQTCDDMLFVDNKTNKHYMIHLTFQGKGTMKGFPGYEVYDSFDDFTKDKLWRDNQYFFDLM